MPYTEGQAIFCRHRPCDCAQCEGLRAMFVHGQSVFCHQLDRWLPFTFRRLGIHTPKWDNPTLIAVRSDGVPFQFTRKQVRTEEEHAKMCLTI